MISQGHSRDLHSHNYRHEDLTPQMNYMDKIHDNMNHNIQFTTCHNCNQKGHFTKSWDRGENILTCSKCSYNQKCLLQRAQSSEHVDQLYHFLELKKPTDYQCQYTKILDKCIRSDIFVPLNTCSCDHSQDEYVCLLENLKKNRLHK